MPYTTLISTNDLFAHLYDPAWVILDTRFDLLKPDWGGEDFQKSHIPGAIYVHMDHDMAAPVTPITGRHPLPDPAVFAARLQQWGVTPQKQVVAYDTTGGAFAARLWWMFRWLGHSSVAVLDGSFTTWLHENRPVTDDIQSSIPAPSPYPYQLHPEMMVTALDVEALRQDPTYRVIDARTPERYRGKHEPIDAVAGHIPGAINRFHGLNLQQNGTFKSAETLRQEFGELVESVPADHLVVYCGSGVTSCHHVLAMEHAGLHGVRLYPGSWSEWIRDPARPVARE